ncbi:MAG: fumarylacetoacetate hydrolase family protein [Immundisolibacter sp.]
MALDTATIAKLAEHLETAELQARDVTKITDDHPDMTLAEAYQVMEAIRERKLARGIRQVGYKMGLTSRAKMVQMGVDKPGYGLLFDYFAVEDGGTIDTKKLIHPKVEAEIAFVTKAPLKGPGVHIGNVLAATDFVLPALEVIDSRYRDFKFDMVSVIADNSSSSRFVTGGRSRAVSEVDLKTLGLVMEKNGQPVGLSCGAAVLGHPAASVAMLANMLGAKGQELPAGSFIMTGGVTAAVAVEAGDTITVHYQDLGSISVNFA